MANLNRVMLIGNLGTNPEMRASASGKGAAILSVATERSYMVGTERKSHTTWHRVIVWGKQGENCVKYLTKGRSVYVDGRLESRQWTDDKGNTNWITEIIAQQIQFLDKTVGNSNVPSFKDIPIGEEDQEKYDELS